MRSIEGWEVGLTIGARQDWWEVDSQNFWEMGSGDPQTLPSVVLTHYSCEWVPGDNGHKQGP